METMKRPNYVEELLEIFRSPLNKEELLDKISDYHENDIAEAFEHLTEEERKKLYPLLGAERMAEIFTYIEEPDEYLKELNLNQVAQVISHMDSDDAVDVLDELDDLIQEKLVGLMDEESSHDIKMIQSYEDDEIGSQMTTNFIMIHKNLSIRQAMREHLNASSAGVFDLLDRVLFISSIHMRFLHSYFRLSDEQSQLRRRRVHAGS